MWIDPNNKTAEAPPPNTGNYIEKWRQTHPDWKILFWNMEMCQDLFLTTPELQPLYKAVFESPWMETTTECTDTSLTTLYLCPLRGISNMKTHKSYTKMAIADTCRLAVVYVYGGVYMDLNINPLKGLDAAWNDYPERDILYCSEPKEHSFIYGNVCLNSLHGARYPKHEFWLRYLEYVCENKNKHRRPHNFSRLDPVTVTGPYVLQEWADNVVTDPRYKPLSACAFARRKHNGQLSEECTEADGYAEKIWATTTGWGTGKKTPVWEIISISSGMIIYSLAVLVAILFLITKGRQLWSST